MDNKITFTTVMYKNPQKILELLTSLDGALTSISNYFIYVVNNDTERVSEDFLVKVNSFKNTALIESGHNKGFGAGNNIVLPKLDSKYHIIINPDVKVAGFDQVKSMIKYMEEHSDVDLLSPKILNTDGTIQKLYKYNPTVLDLAIRFISPNLFKKRQARYVHEHSNYNQIGEIEHASGAFMLFRTETFLKIGGFDERYFMYMEDADITRMVNEHGRAIFYPEASVIHEWQRASHKSIKGMMMMMSSMVKYFQKWGWQLW